MKKQNYRKFVLLWCGQLISAIGGGISSFGLGVYVFNQTHSVTSMSLITLVAFLPGLLLATPAGVLADRYDRRVLMMLGDGLSGLGIVFILLNMRQGEASLIAICIGLLVSSIFSALIEPAYKATVTDLLTKEEYSKASGMISIAGSARYLISPVIAGILLTISDIRLLLCIDIATFAVTVLTTLFVRKGISVKVNESNESFIASLKEGFKAVSDNKGLFLLVVISCVITCFLGMFQILVEPMILDFADSSTLGITESICACGMLVSGVLLGFLGMKKGFVKLLSRSLSFAGLMMLLFGCYENIAFMRVVGFLFFAMLPLANNSLDYLARVNVDASMHGRVWGIIGFISQLGYVIAYSTAGIFADMFSRALNVSIGRGASVVIMISGAMLCAIALTLFMLEPIKQLSEG